MIRFEVSNFQIAPARKVEPIRVEMDPVLLILDAISQFQLPDNLNPGLCFV